MKKDIKVTFWGTQGSTAVNSYRKARYGSNTPCVSVECGGFVFVFDMGTGFLPFGEYFLKKYKLPKSIELFVSHYHMDHIEGLPFAGMTYTPGVSINVHAMPICGKSPSDILSHFFSPPYCPTDLIKSAPPGRFVFDEISPAQVCSFDGGAITVENFPVRHPGGSLSYKLTYNGKSFCYLSDFEYDGNMTPELMAYLNGCDLTVFDAYFSNDSLIAGWGHSTWEQGVEIWRETGIKKMAMYHHNIACTDKEMENLENKLIKISPNLILAKDGMELHI